MLIVMRRKWVAWLTVTAAAAVGLACPRRLVTTSPPLEPVTKVPDLSGPADCGGHGADALMACVSRERIETDARAIAKPRPPGSPHHADVKRRCGERFTELGYEAELHDYGTGVNVLGTKPGFSKPDEIVVVGAHYDQKGTCPGADDNASGVAALLELARVLSKARFDRTLVVACWDEGERGQLGSRAHAERAKKNETQVALAVSLEAVAYASDEKETQHVPEGFERLFPDQALALLDDDYRANFLTVVAETSTEKWADRIVAHGKAIELDVRVLTLTERMKVKQRELHPSDHVSFWDRTYPAMLITDSGPYRNDRIGCENGADSADTLSYPFAAQTTRASLGAIVEALELR
jgi:Zn-dependent M28 family amino/carboxypeptidase